MRVTHCRATRHLLALFGAAWLYKLVGLGDAGPATEAQNLAPTKLVFREDRATQAAAFLLKLNKKRIKFPFMRHIKLIKLMYIAEREALLQLGHLITYDRLMSMDNGPVLSRVLDLVKGSIGTGYWRQHIKRWFPYWVHLISDPSTDQLSVAEEKILSDVYRRYGHLNRHRLIDISHELPEWRDPKGSALPIEPRDVLISQKVPAEEADEIVADMVAAASL
jgi:uncharacterized phage-associated protein